MADDRAHTAPDEDEDEKKLDAALPQLLALLDAHRATHLKTRALKEEWLMKLDDPAEREKADIRLRQIAHIEENERANLQMLEQSLADLRDTVKHNDVVRLTKEQIRSATASAAAAEELNRFTGALVAIGVGQVVFALAQVLVAVLKRS